jgi:hypothetical protein
MPGMRHLVALLLLAAAAAPSVARAGSVDGPGEVIPPPPPPPPYEPRWHVNLDGGWTMYAGSNGGAFAGGPTGRITASVDDERIYHTIVSYTYSTHEIDDPAKLFGEPVAIEGFEGSASLHWVTAGAKVFPLVPEDKDLPVRPIQPWVSSTVGLVITDGRHEMGPLSGRTVRPKFGLDLAGGVDWRLAKWVGVGASLRAAAMPGIRPTDEGNARLEILYALNPGVAAIAHF